MSSKRPTKGLTKVAPAFAEVVQGDQTATTPKSRAPDQVTFEVDGEERTAGFSGRPNPAWEDLPADRREDLAHRMALFAAIGLVAFFAVFHGHAHGTELEPGQNALLYSLGFVIATGMLHGVGIAIGLIHRWDLGRLLLRIGGALVMAGGLYFLWNATA